ncbi:metallophosphoesterase [Edaphocola flava]|uniref:metallophosphoesterase n=1 Tax=Edaphocola flava TaxID=2499629 RepID=UPI00100BA3F6|nr:metallophosphoesterase [Edaphocola flava]
MSRTLVIGDIHGGLRGLEQVMDRAAVTTSDTLIFLGDYVDGWSESAQVIRFLMAAGKLQHCIFIKGNHDVKCEQWLRGEVDMSIWAKNGGLSTIKSYEQVSDAEKREHLEFFERMKPYYIDQDNRLFVHAGFTAQYGVDHEAHQSAFNTDRTLWEMVVVMDRRVEQHSALYPKRLKLYHEIYIGHTPTLNYGQRVPMQAINVWNVDTGSAFDGSLSLIDADTKDFWQSDPLPQLYPDERGRNAKPFNEQ